MVLHRQSGSWMSVWDDRVLEILSTEGPKPPSKISNKESIHVGTSNISLRLSKLKDNNLVDSLGNGVYQITKEGEEYLLGNYDAENGEYIDQMNFNITPQVRVAAKQTTFDQFANEELQHKYIKDLENVSKRMEPDLFPIRIDNQGNLSESNNSTVDG